MQAEHIVWNHSEGSGHYNMTGYGSQSMYLLTQSSVAQMGTKTNDVKLKTGIALNI